MIVGGYQLHLYCDNEEGAGREGHHQGCWEYASETGPQARQMARAEGWQLYLKVGKAFCPYCTGHMKIPEELQDA